MAIDFGFLNALSGTKNWDAIRNDKRAALMYQQGANQLAEQKNKENEAAAAEVQKYQPAIQDMPVLPQGLERIKALSDTLKGPIAEGIKESNGDLEKWIKTRGMVDLHNYINTIYHHPTTQKELQNAVSKAHWQADQQAGLTERLLNPDGTQRNTFSSQLQDYENGKTDTLNYSGGFKAGKFDDSVFTKEFGGPNHYQPKPVDAKDYVSKAYQQLIDGGMNPTDARQQAITMGANYKQHVDSKGTPLYWKNLEYTPNMRLTEMKIKKMQQAGLMNEGGSYLARVYNNLATQSGSNADGSVKNYLPDVRYLHQVAGNLGFEMDEKNGGIKNVPLMTARGPVFSADFSQKIDFSGLDGKDVVVKPTNLLRKTGPDGKPQVFMGFTVSEGKDAANSTTVDGGALRSAPFNPFTRSHPAAGEKTVNGKHEFTVFQEIPYNETTVSSPKEQTKSAQQALSVGIQDQKFSEMLQDLDTEQDTGE